ncbi:unnamed protein product [Protopolystoma xenopodis]|uniref:Uncharacterized protein n=1 Tax=Protopolystoma xenopodis TaxID=117903 RepID=A0A448WYF1_9PLAT|nr:unnamed protein product [Protopolystoma xenopodis]
MVQFRHLISWCDDARHITDESSARIHRGHRPVRRGSIRTNLQPQLQVNPPQPPVEPTYEFLPLASSNEIKGTPT